MDYTGNMSALLIAEYRIITKKEKGFFQMKGMFINNCFIKYAKELQKNII